MKKRETFIWVGDGMRALEPGELVGKKYRDKNGRVGKIVENSYLDLTVEFENRWEWNIINQLKPR